MPNCSYQNFDIALLGQVPPYIVTATHNGRSAQGVFTFNAQQAIWRDYLASLANPRRLQSVPDLVATVGSALFRELMRDEILHLWIEARSSLTAADAPRLRIRLMIRPTAVDALPWESLHDPHRQQPLGADGRLALVRVANQAIYVDHSRPLKAHPPLKILLVAVEDNSGLDLAGEIANIREKLAPLEPDRISLHLLKGRIGIHDLRRALETEKPDVLHIISHGQPDGLLLWTQEETLELVTDLQIQAVLRRAQSVKLVFLNACLAGQPDADEPFGSVAHRILQAGVPAVVGMQFVITDRAAIAFAGYLYEALVSGPCAGAIDAAVGAARQNLYISDPRRLDYMTPVLWLNVDDGMIYRTTAPAAAPADPPIESSLPETHQAPPQIDFSLADKKRWLQALPETLPQVELRFDYQRRRRNLAGLLKRLQQDQQEQTQGKPLDLHQVEKRLALFSQERRYLENLLQSLNQRK